MKIKHVYLIILMIALIGCGGGGSNNETPEQANTAPELVGLIDFAIDENLWYEDENKFMHMTQ